MAIRETEQVRGSVWRSCVLRMRDTDGAWWRVECVLVRQKLQPACEGACEVVSSRSWLGFARDWLFCHSMPLL